MFPLRYRSGAGAKVERQNSLANTARLADCAHVLSRDMHPIWDGDSRPAQGANISFLCRHCNDILFGLFNTSAIYHVAHLYVFSWAATYPLKLYVNDR